MPVSLSTQQDYIAYQLGTLMLQNIMLSGQLEACKRQMAQLEPQTEGPSLEATAEPRPVKPRVGLARGRTEHREAQPAGEEPR